MISTTPSQAVEQLYPARAKAYYTLAILLLAYILSFIDRQILSFLVGPIREHFGISDFQFSLLHGMAFAIFYTVLGLPIGRMADRHNRCSIITVGILLWSVMTGMCGLASSYLLLFIARMGVGVGEATLSPSAYSLLSDMFPAKVLGRAIAVFTMGITIGSGFAFIIGGTVYDFFSSAGAIAVPLFGELQPWQLTFLVVGAPGLLLVLLMLPIKEPPRLGSVQTHVTPTEQPHFPIKAVLGFMLSNRRVYGALIVGVSLMSVMGYATLSWYPEFLLRTYGMSKSSGGQSFGAIAIVAGTLGTLAGAWFTELLAKKGYRDAHLRLIMLAALALIVPSVAGPLMPTAALALLLAAPAMFIFYTHFAVAMTALQLITPNAMRAQVSAVMLFLTSLLGIGMGSTLVAFFTDYVFQNDLMLNRSLAVVAAMVYPAVALICRSGLKHYAEMLPKNAE